MKHDSIKHDDNEGLLFGRADSAISILCLMRAISISLSSSWCCFSLSRLKCKYLSKIFSDFLAPLLDLTSINIYCVSEDQSEDQKAADRTYISGSHKFSFFSSPCWPG